MELRSQGNKEKYSINTRNINEVIVDEFGHESLPIALGLGIVPAAILGEAVANQGRRAFSMSSGVFGFTTRALIIGETASSAIVGGAVAIALAIDTYSCIAYNNHLKEMASDAVEKLESKGYGYIVLETEDFAYVSANGNHWSGNETMPTKIYWSSRRKGTLLD